ncbi:MAG: hypothetical protein ACI8RZ_002311 [Myxococcota bacterium]|jgi:hypothetical protein
MRGEIVDFLLTHADPDHLLIEGIVVAASAHTLLEQGLVSDIEMHAGRLLCVADPTTLIAARQHPPLLGWLKHLAEEKPALKAVLYGHRCHPEGWPEQAAVLIARRVLGQPDDSEAHARLLSITDQRDRPFRQILKAMTRPPPAPPRHRRARPVDQTAVPTLTVLFDSGDIEGVRAQIAWAVDYIEYLQQGELTDLATTQCAFGLVEDARKTIDRIPGRGRELRPILLGEAGRVEVAKEKQDLLDAIEVAFGAVGFPGPDHRSLHQAEAADSYDSWDQSEDHKGTWQTLPRAHLLRCQWALGHLDAHGMQYILPAAMSLWIREAEQAHDDHGSGWIFESTLFTLYIEKPDSNLRAYQEQRFERFTRAQFAAVARFATYAELDEKHIRGWEQLARGEDWPRA